LDKLIELTNDRDLANKIWEASREVVRYTWFKRAQDIGVKHSPQDLKFTDMIVYSWIMDGLGNGRKT
jgi:hypothetical protein